MYRKKGLCLNRRTRCRKRLQERRSPYRTPDSVISCFCRPTFTSYHRKADSFNQILYSRVRFHKETSDGKCSVKMRKLNPLKGIYSSERSFQFPKQLIKHLDINSPAGNGIIQLKMGLQKCAEKMHIIKQVFVCGNSTTKQK